MARDFDVAVIGAGPGGYVAAIRAAQLGLKVAVIERAELGGICLNWGCIPTKALLRSAEVLHLMHEAQSFGLSAEGIGFDLDAIVKRSRGVSRQLSSGVAHLLRKNGVEVIRGRARLSGPTTVEVEAETPRSIEAGAVILATGARARVLPGLEPDGQRIWSYRHALVPPFLPRRLAVLGSGAIGIEFASFYRALGVEVTVIELAPRILPVEDAEIAALATRSFEKQGMRILAGASIETATRGEDGLSLTIRQGETRIEMAADALISAVGIVGNVEDLGLEDLGVTIERSHVVTDARCRTGVPGLYAIGDVAGAPWLAHKASHEGVMVAEHLAGLTVHPIRADRIAGCTYCRPQIASVGLTEEKARAAGHEIRVGRFPFIGNGKAIALGEAEGLIKTIFDAKTGELLGAHMVGAEVTELIQGFVVAMGLETTEAELMETVFPHPTLSEMMHESTLAAWERALHI
ncbi:dihydrolipoyl dehydrogenase [Phaeovulum vinaykumarii]|nr:dihydrolipoyl dehydrogenase [Phaeovulum vinaykumarii]